MKNLYRKIIIFLLVAVCCLVSVACGGREADRTPDGKRIIEFWGWGELAETNAFQYLVDVFNERNDSIHVNFTKRPKGTYEEDLLTNLGSRKPVDVAFVGDAAIKKTASISKTPLIEDLTPYIEKSEVIDLDDIWETQMDRFQFDTKTFRNSPDAPIWGLPKDLGPTVVYYNKTAMNAAGITVVEDMPIEKVEAEDERHGFYTKNGQKYFNNSIAMTWEEMLELGRLLTKSQNKSSPTDYGFYSQWWFFLGWSVGGDMARFIDSDDANYAGGYWDFCLGDTDPNYIVKNGNAVTVNNTTYAAGEIIGFDDRKALTASDKAACTQLPSMREAFDFFVSLDTGKDAAGNVIPGRKISPQPSDGADSSLFTSGKLAMYVDGRSLVPEFRRSCTFEWDVAPLPKHKDGIEAGHSGSMCISMASRSKAKDAAFELIEFLSGPEGQAVLVETGFNVPNQKSLAESDLFLKSEQRPFNNRVFFEAARWQRGGDWTYLPDDAWIEIWAPTLNGDVRNGLKTVDQLFSTHADDVKQKLKSYTQV